MKNNKKILTLFGLILGLVNYTIAQENHGGVLNAFVKFGDNINLSANYEFQIAPNLTISPEGIISVGDDAWIGVGARADYYFDSLLKLDTSWDIWAGVDSGFLINKDNGDNISINAHAGVEYKFNDTWGVIAEFGGGTISSGGIGVGIHFK